MSKYADYDKISQTYDESRTAVGIEIILGFLASLDTPMQDLHILDAGCGTGNYAVKIKEKVAHVTCADVSKGMLEQANKKLKLSNKGGTYNLVECDISNLPIEEQKYDAVICNQSLHHLDQPGDDFKNQRQFFTHVKRVLNPNGLLIINTITHEQLREGVWWGDLIKPAVDRMTHRFTSADKLHELLAANDFKITNRVVPVDTIIQQEGYFNPNSLRSEAFRNGDSHFSLLSADELNSVLSKLDALEADQGMAAYIEDRDKLRLQYGQFTFFVARKINS